MSIKKSNGAYIMRSVSFVRLRAAANREKAETTKEIAADDNVTAPGELPIVRIR